MTSELYDSLNEMLENKFGNILCNPPSSDRDISTMTLNSLSAENSDAIVFYNNAARPENTKKSEKFLKKKCKNFEKKMNKF